jgi:hypothetical protein
MLKGSFMPLEDPLSTEPSIWEKVFGKPNSGLAESLRKYLGVWIAAGLGFLALVVGFIIWLISSS